MRDIQSGQKLDYFKKGSIDIQRQEKSYMTTQEEATTDSHELQQRGHPSKIDKMANQNSNNSTGTAVLSDCEEDKERK